MSDDALRINIAGNAKAEAAGIEQQLAKVEERAETNREVLKDLQRELRGAKARAADLAKAYQELGDEALRAAAKTAYEEARESVEDLASSVSRLKGEQRSAKSEAQDLKGQLREINTEAKRAQREGARALAQELRKADEEAKKLNSDLDPSRAKKVADELERGARAGSARGRSGGFNLGSALSTAAGNLISSGAQQAAAAAAEWVRSIPEGAAAAERHRNALRALGSAYVEVQRATRGSVSAEQAYAVQQRLTESGLALNGRQLAAVTARARDYARAVGIDTNQALEQLTEGLNQGTSEGLRRFGITVQTGATRTETFTSALRQLEQQEGHAAHAAVSVAEAEEQLSQALSEANHSVQALVAEKIGLADFFQQSATWVRELTDGTRSLSGELRSAAAAFGLLDDARAQHINQSASGEFGQQAQEALDRARAAGVDTTGLPQIGNFAVNATPQQRQQFLAIINRMIAARTGGARTQGVDPATARAARGLFGDATGVGTLRDLGAENGLTDPNREALRALAGQAEADSQRRRREEEERRRREEEERQRILRQTGAREAGARLQPADADAVREARAELERVRGQLLEAGFGRGLGLRGADPTLRLQGTSDQGVVMERFDPSKRNLQAEQLEVLRQRAAETEARRGENELARLQRLTQATQAYMQAQGEQAQRELQQAERANEMARTRALSAANESEERRRHETESLAEAATILQTQQAQVQALNALYDAERQGIYQADNAHAVSSAERLRQVSGLRVALQGLLAETNARIESMAAEGRSQAELNAILQQRIQLQQALAQTTREQTQIQREQQASTIAYRDAMVGTLSQTADAFAASSISALESGKSWGAATQEMLRSTMFAVAKQSIVETLKGTAMGFIALAQGNIPAATSAFTGAGIWAATGIAAGGIAVAIPKPQTQGAPTAASAPAPRAAQLGPSERNGNGTGSLNLTINVSGAAFNEGVEDGIVRAIDSAARRGMIPRVIRHATA